MITVEKLKHHISHLQEQHRDLDKHIHELYEQRDDDLHLESLKKKRLALKDEIVKMEDELKKLSS